MNILSPLFSAICLPFRNSEPNNPKLSRLIACLYFAVIFAQAAVAQPISSGLESEIIRRVNQEINPSISIGILDQDGTMTFYNYGHKEGPKSAAPDSTTRYEIGSITKTFTASLLESYLAESLDTPVNTWFPEISNEALAQFTLREIRNHKSGLPRLSPLFSPSNWADPFADYSAEQLQLELSKLSLDSTKNWQYSNLGYTILGAILEQKLNAPYKEIMPEFLARIGMQHSLVSHTSNNGQNMAEPSNCGTRFSNWHLEGPSGFAGGIISCTADMLKYLEFLKLNNSLFNKNFSDAFIETPIKVGKEWKLSYLNGWFNLKADSADILFHNGGTGGYISFLGYNKNSHTGVVILSNGSKSVDDLGLQILFPSFPLAKPQRSVAYQLADAIERGVEDLQAIADSAKASGVPDAIMDLYWLERFQFGKKNYKMSVQLAGMMASTLPNDWEVMDILGQNYEALQKFKEALAAYESAQKLNPANPNLAAKIERCREGLK